MTKLSGGSNGRGYAAASAALVGSPSGGGLSAATALARRPSSIETPSSPLVELVHEALLLFKRELNPHDDPGRVTLYEADARRSLCLYADGTDVTRPEGLYILMPHDKAEPFAAVTARVEQKGGLEVVALAYLSPCYNLDRVSFMNHARGIVGENKARSQLYPRNCRLHFDFPAEPQTGLAARLWVNLPWREYEQTLSDPREREAHKTLKTELVGKVALLLVGPVYEATYRYARPSSSLAAMTPESLRT